MAEIVFFWASRRPSIWYSNNVSEETPAASAGTLFTL
jgi:hypothetical protein